MIIDIHGHIMAPPELYMYQAMLIASGGHHGKQGPRVSDDQLIAAMSDHMQMLRDVGTDVQFISPRPFTLMHSQQPPVIIDWYVEAANDLIARQVAMQPDLLRGVCGLPQSMSRPIEHCFGELERCINDLGFIGCLLNPDPSEGTGNPPPLGDPYWYPLYEKLVDMDVPALVHSASCRNCRETYSNHFITEESIAVLSLVEERVLDRFPDLKLIISHGGGSVPYQIGRWRAHELRTYGTNFDEHLRKLYFDTVLYNYESIELLFKVVGPDRCLFGTEKPGSGTAPDPVTGRFLDDIRPLVEMVPGLSDEQRSAVFETNARQVFSRFRG